MTQTATPKRGSSSAKKTSGKKRSASNGSRTKAAAKAAVLATRPGKPVRRKAARAAAKGAAKSAGRLVRRTVEGALPAALDGPRAALDRVRDAGWDRVAERMRKLPIQRSVDVAVPLEAAWDEWMRFEWVPDGANRVQGVERDGDLLTGRLTGWRLARDWEAEIVDEREDESFAWQTLDGSDTSGLVTFHRLSERLTRIELELDVVPGRMGEAVSLVARVADKRAETVLRGFKAQVEALDPDEYPPLAQEVEEDEPD
jgi:uncharacterized membrane protein